MRLLKIEWLKLKKYRTFYILLGLFVAVYTIFNIAVNHNAFTLKTPGKNGQSINLVNSNYSFPKVWDNMGYYLGWCLIFICVLVIINVTNDFRFKTQRQHIIDGQSRSDYLHSKAILVLGLTFAITIIYIISSVIFGLANGGTDILNGATNVGHVFLYVLNYLSFSALLALLIKRSGLSIMLLLTFVTVEEVAIKLLKELRHIDISRFSPLDCSDMLLVKPIDGMAKAVINSSVSASHHYTMEIMSIVWVIVYYLIARLRLQKADL